MVVYIQIFAIHTPNLMDLHPFCEKNDYDIS